MSNSGMDATPALLLLSITHVNITCVCVHVAPRKSQRSDLVIEAAAFNARRLRDGRNFIDSSLLALSTRSAYRYLVETRLSDATRSAFPPAPPSVLCLLSTRQSERLAFSAEAVCDLFILAKYLLQRPAA